MGGFINPWQFDGPSQATRDRQLAEDQAERQRRIDEARSAGRNKFQEPGLVGWLEGANTPIPEQPSARVPTIQEAAAAPRRPAPKPNGIPTIEEAARALDDLDATEALRNTNPLKHLEDARPAFEQRAQREEQRRTIRQMPDGTFTNVGTGGNVVMRNGESVGPDLGAPGRGGVSFPGGNDDAAYANYRRNLMGDAAFEQEQAGIARNRMLAEDPLAVERFSIERQIALQDAQTRNTYDRERLRQQAEQDFRAGVLGQQSEVEQYAESERQRLRSTPQYMNAPMEQKAQMEKAIDDWLSSERARLGIPEGAEWNRIG